VMVREDRRARAGRDGRGRVPMRWSGVEAQAMM
jgi:hypothetical protein